VLHYIRYLATQALASLEGLTFFVNGPLAIFGVAFEYAHLEATGALVEAAWSRAVDGVERPRYQRGELVGRVTEHSDYLLAFLLRDHAPEKYRERHVARASSGGSVEDVLTEEQRQTIASAYLAAVPQ
jgi:hypothetical protein